MTTPQGMLADKIRSGELELIFCHPDGKFPALSASQEQRDLVEAALRQAAAPQGREALVAQVKLLMRLANNLNVSDAALGMRIRNLRADFRSALTPAVAPDGAGEDDLCQCPKCGRMHRGLGAGKPPAIISGEPT